MCCSNDEFGSDFNKNGAEVSEFFGGEGAGVWWVLPPPPLCCQPHANHVDLMVQITSMRSATPNPPLLTSAPFF